MRRLRPGLAWILAFVTIALLGASAPSWAHTEFVARSFGEAAPHAVGVAPTSDGDDSRVVTLSAAPETPRLPWPAFLGALIAVALGWRRPRRALALAVVLLLAIFAFEDGLHSVHHLAGQGKIVTCKVAVATAHLTATAVDDIAQSDVILPVIAVPTESVRPDPVARFLCPDQGRAPPPPSL